MGTEQEPEEEEQDSPLSASILLVDDVPANLLALEATLEPLGHRIVKARSGNEALRHVLDEDFAVILMDVQMPDLDGFQTVALIKQRPKSVHVPIIFVTAIAKEAQHISKGYEYGAVDYMTKPFDADILRCKVSVLVALHLQAERIVRQRALLLERRHALHRHEIARDAAESASRMKDQFLAVISHELRAPLNAILGWTEMLVKGGLDEAKTLKAIETIRRNAHAQQRLVDDLIDISRMITGNLQIAEERVELSVLVHKALDARRPEADAKRVSLKAVVERDGIVTGDEKRLQQILANLISNAVKFTPADGSIEVCVSPAGDHAQIAVTDTGIGIAAEDLPFVFDRFWQADRGPARPQPGLGLGLAIVRQLVELHGGAVHASSAGLGQGATFVVALPLASAHDAREARADSSP